MRLFLFLIYRCGSLVCSVLCIVQEEVRHSFQFYFSLCVAALSGNACETRLLADKSFHRLMLCWVWRTKVYHVVSRFPKKADGGSKISERQWVRESLEAAKSAGSLRGKNRQQWERMNPLIDFPPFSLMFQHLWLLTVSGIIATHFQPCLSTRSWYGQSVVFVLESPETAFLRHSSLLGH